MRPRMKRAGQGKSTPEDNGRNKKAMIVLLLALVFFSLSATVAEAALRDSIRSGWSSIRVYVLSAPFWVNVLILFGVGMVLYTLLLAKSMGSDNSTKAIIYIVLILIAIVIATKFMGDDGKPEYLWRNDQFRNFTRFLIGPKDSLGACPSSHSGWRALAGLNPNPPCCGTGAYWTLAEGERVCKQAILRTNVAGTGLPALIFAFLAFYLLFGAYGGKLGFDRMGSGGGKWFPIFLSLVLAALIANERVPKNHILVIAGWVALVLIGNALSKSLSNDKDGKGSKKGFGFGLAYAFVQLILNMFGTTLFGRTVNASDIGASTIVWNLIIGMGIGFIYGMITSGGGILSKVGATRAAKKVKDIDKALDEGRYWDAIKRWMGLRLKDNEKEKAEKLRKDINEITNDLDMVGRLYNLQNVQNNANLRNELDNKVTRLENKLTDALRKSP